MLSANTDAPLFVRPVDPNVPPSDRPRLVGQNAKVLARLRQGPLTCTEALGMGVRRLAARIHDIKKHGYRVLTTPLANHDTLYTLLPGGGGCLPRHYFPLCISSPRISALLTTPHCFATRLGSPPLFFTQRPAIPSGVARHYTNAARRATAQRRSPRLFSSQRIAT